MKPRMSICLFLLLLLSSGMSAAQVNDWKNVQKLPPGTDIEVRAPHGLFCNLLSVTPEKLTCSARRHGEFVFLRNEVREVRLRRGKHNDKWGQAIGATAGASVGYAKGGPIGAIALGAGGLVAGEIIGGGSQLFLHGKVVYRR